MKKITLSIVAGFFFVGSAHSNVNPLSLNQTSTYAKLVHAAYQSSVSSVDNDVGGITRPYNKQMYSSTFNYGIYRAEGELISQGGDCVVSIRGTDSWGDVSRDLQLQVQFMENPLKKYPNDINWKGISYPNLDNTYVAAGVYTKVNNFYATVKNDIELHCQVNDQISVVGHSLGGAAAQLFSFWYMNDSEARDLTRMISYNSPRLASVNFLKSMDILFNQPDIMNPSKWVNLCREHDPVKAVPAAAFRKLYRLNSHSLRKNDRACTYVAPSISSRWAPIPNHNVDPWKINYDSSIDSAVQSFSDLNEHINTSNLELL